MVAAYRPIVTNQVGELKKTVNVAPFNVDPNATWQNPLYDARDADDIMARLADFHVAGAHKFILRPMAFGTDDMINQTRQMIDQVLPRVKAMNSP